MSATSVLARPESDYTFDYSEKNIFKHLL